MKSSNGFEQDSSTGLTGSSSSAFFATSAATSSRESAALKDDAKLMAKLESNPIFLWPVSRELMTAPVIGLSGKTYDKASFQEVIRQRDLRCPITRQPLALESVIS